MTKQAMVAVSNLRRMYGEVAAVNDVSFSIDHGDIVGLLGHNGAGKTTVMKMLTGYLEPTSGAITIDGLSLAVHRRKIQSKIGYLPENCPVYPEMSVASYLDYGATLHGVPASRRPELIRTALRKTALIDKADQPIATLSRGYRQRTGVAKAILHNPSLLILDEPTNGLDPTQIQHMRELIRALAKNATIIISTHILPEVQAVCNRAIILNAGRMVFDSRLDELGAGNRLLLTLDQPGDRVTKTLAAIDGVFAVEWAPDATDHPGSTFLIHLNGGHGANRIAADIARTVHENGWQLFGLSRHSRTLESLFAEISSREEVSP
jgi:ABC-2 type transport system ATP-binding protein